MADGLLGAYFGNPNVQRQGARARELAKQRDVNLLADPKTYAVVQGLLGNAPDQLGFSVLNPKYQEIKQVAEPAFYAGSLLQAAPLFAPMTKGLPIGASIKNVSKIDQATGLPLNADGTVTLFHHTNKTAAEQITKTGKLKSAGEPSVYLTTQKTPDTGYGDVVVPVRVKPSLLNLDDEFPSGRMDFSIDTGKPKGSIPVTVEKHSLEYPQEEALRLAQQRAALPMEQGGLGLPVGNTPMDRAKAMGFDINAFHGSKDPSIMAFDPSMAGKSTSNAFDQNIWATSSPEVARGYSLNTNQFSSIPQAQEIKSNIDSLKKKYSEAYQSGKFDEMDTLREQINTAQNQSQDLYKSFLRGEIASEGSTIYPLMMRSSELMPYEAEGKNWMRVNRQAIEQANERGYGGVNIKNVSDNTQASDKIISDTYATENPDLIRSRFAAFDPWRKTAAIAATMGVATPDLMAQEVDYTLLPAGKKQELLRSLLGQ